MRPFREMTSDFRRRALEIGCVEMLLVQRASEIPIRFKGKGYIHQTVDDKLTCKIFAEESENITQWEWVEREISGKPGKLYSPNDYFDLIAKDTRGNVWTAKKILLNVGWHNAKAAPIIAMGLDEINLEGRATEIEHSVSLYFFEDAELPLIADLFEFSKDSYKFVIQKLEGSFTVEVSSSSALPEGFAGRVEESLCFILTQSFSWRALSVSDGQRRTFHLAAAVSRSLNTRLSPPIERRKSHAYISECWNLFFLYLKYIINNSKHGYWNHCSYHLHNACKSSANSLDAWAYGLSIAVEGLSSLLPSKKSRRKCTPQKYELRRPKLY